MIIITFIGIYSLGMLAVLMIKLFYLKYSTVDRYDVGMSTLWPMLLVIMTFSAPYIHIGHFIIQRTMKTDKWKRWIIRHSSDFDLYRGKDAFEILLNAKIGGIMYTVESFDDLEEARRQLKNYSE